VRPLASAEELVDLNRGLLQTCLAPRDPAFPRGQVAPLEGPLVDPARVGRERARTARERACAERFRHCSRAKSSPVGSKAR